MPLDQAVWRFPASRIAFGGYPQKSSAAPPPQAPQVHLQLQSIWHDPGAINGLAMICNWLVLSCSDPAIGLYMLVWSCTFCPATFSQVSSATGLRRVASCCVGRTCLYGIRAKAPCRPGKSGPDSADLNGQRQTTLRSSREKKMKRYQKLKSK